MSTTSQSNLSLFYFYWSPIFFLRIGHINVPSETRVFECRETILQAEKETGRSSTTDLYTIPQNHAVLSEASLGSLSISDLGEPLPLNESLENIFGPQPEADRIHLIIVNRDIPFTIKCWIHGTDHTSTLKIEMQRDKTVLSLLQTIKEKSLILRDEATLTLHKTAFSGPEDLSQIFDSEGQLLFADATLATAFSDIPFSKRPCVIVKRVRREIKRHLSWDLVERATKRTKLFSTVPSVMAPQVYCSLQANADDRFFDYRTRDSDLQKPDALPENDLPPIEVLFDGFGTFLETWRAAFRPGVKTVSLDMKENVDMFADVMSNVYDNKGARRDKGLRALNDIFSTVLGARQIVPGEIASVTPGARSGRTDGHCLHRNYSIPLIIVEFENEDAGTDAIPAIALASYYDCMIANVGCNSPQVVARSRLPTLGPTVTFFGLAYVGSVVYVPLTTGLWCLPVEVGGSDRHQLYIAFDAAVTLLASIEREAERFGEVSTFPPRIEHPFFPRIDELDSLDDPGSSVKFQITEGLQNNFSGHVYKASSSRGDLIIKLTRSYSADLHKFCAQSGFAPELRAFQRLPGGIIAIATDYLDGDTLASLSFIPPERGDKWINRLNEVVEELHKNGFVHGDLRPPNILCDPKSDRVMLLDFDWGGKAGDACYPHRRLNPQLTEGRDMSSLKITEDDDKRVLNKTLEYIREITTAT
ncbi:hypothetical protein OG21DRAFT_1486834 [Imleria badia]|nr:hypothetical protein OG21DRAFT_1486834 [Imleria badia]